MIILLASLFAIPHAAAVDCSKAVEKAEKTVCATPDLKKRKELSQPPGKEGAANSALDALRGHYGFDWLKPAQAKCEALDAPRIAKLKKQGARCARGETESFTPGAGAWHQCKVSSTSEYMIYENRKICEDQLGTMQANGP